MIIHGLTVCVGYAEFLSRGIERWMGGLASLTVVTTPGDAETTALAQAHGARVISTDLFYRDGATFNKGRAMEHGRMALPPSDWVLFFDADVVPPADWRARLKEYLPQPGALYGCRRFDAGEDLEDWGQPSCAGDVAGVGYFQLFHSGDPAVERAPVIETHWAHAGNYDNRFMDRWRSRGIAIRQLPFRVAHIGEHKNWCGRGNTAAFEALLAERARRGGTWQHERIEVGR